MEARTVAALDVITAFAVPNLSGYPFWEPLIFSGLVTFQVALAGWSPSLLRWSLAVLLKRNLFDRRQAQSIALPLLAL